VYLKDVFTEFVFKRIRKLRLEMTAIIFVCGHFGRVTPLLHPAASWAKKCDSHFNGVSCPNSNYEAASYWRQ